MSNFEVTSDPLVDIPALIKWRGDGLTFVELLRYLPYLNGDEAYGKEATNVIFWIGLSTEGIEAIVALLNNGTIRATSTQPLTYMIDGKGLRLPIAKSNRKYTKAHWAPITFSLPAGKRAAAA
jgi:hypothetical protein